MLPATLPLLFVFLATTGLPQVIRLLRQLGLLRSTVCCPACRATVQLGTLEDEKSRLGCSTHGCPRSFTVKYGSLFARFNLPIDTVLKVCMCFAQAKSPGEALSELKGDITDKTIRNIYKQLRLIIKWETDREKHMGQLGGRIPSLHEPAELMLQAQYKQLVADTLTVYSQQAQPVRSKRQIYRTLAAQRNLDEVPPPRLRAIQLPAPLEGWASVPVDVDECKFSCMYQQPHMHTGSTDIVYAHGLNRRCICTWAQ